MVRYSPLTRAHCVVFRCGTLQPVGLPSQDLWQGVVGANHHTIFTPHNILSVAASHY